MPTTLFAVLVLSGAALYFMTPDERSRLARSAAGAVQRAIRAQSSASGEPFDEFLRARTRWPIVTPLLVVLNAVVFTLMLFDRGALAEAQTLIDWGANFAPRTTNDEWWRLIAATFVHGGVLHFLATVAGVVPLGLVLERAVGRIAFAAVYLAAGVIAGVVSLWTASPTSVTIGASGAIFGIYGLLLATLAWGVVTPLPVRVPLMTVKRIAAAAVPFFLYNLVTDDLGTTSELAGLGAGFIAGLIVASRVARERPPIYRAAMVVAAATVIVIAAALPLRGIVDFRPELAQIAALEARTAGVYDAAVTKFRIGRMPAKALAQLINRTIIPDLEAGRARVHAIRGVPREQAPLVAAAVQYFELRQQSWRRRAEGLLTAKMEMLREAERTEQAALKAFRRVQPST